MTTMMMERTEAHGGGKVLVAGGYAVLERNTGLSLTVSARFYTRVEEDVDDDDDQQQQQQQQQHQQQQHQQHGDDCDDDDDDEILWHINAPQFNYTITYRYKIGADTLVIVDPVPKEINSFIHICLKITLKYIDKTQLRKRTNRRTKKNTPREIRITTLADNDFYSQQDELEARKMKVNRENLKCLPPFLPSSTSVKKTGLGSSAGLVVSFVTALLSHLVDIDDENVRHNLSQLVHCVAQKGIGSGYDISSVVHGSGLYTRFSPTMITNELGLDFVDRIDDLTREQIQRCVDQKWDYSFTPLFRQQQQQQQQQRKPRLGILLGDVAQGSSTTGLVKKLNQWRNDNHTLASQLWQHLLQSNSEVIDIYVAFASSTRDDHVEEDQKVSLLKKKMKTMRSAFAQLGDASSLPLEPVIYRDLLNRTEEIDGVIGVGCPGAGGYDAIFAVIDTAVESVAKKVEQLWLSNTIRVCPLLCDADHRGVVCNKIRIRK